MKLLAFYSIIVIFVPLLWVAEVRGIPSSDIEINIENSEQICKDFEDLSQDSGCIEASSENTFLVNTTDEGYVDDIPFDTEKVIEMMDVNQEEMKAEKAKDENFTIFQLFIRWVTLLLRLN